MKKIARIEDIIQKVITEMAGATEKYPTWPSRAIDAFMIVGEECGELNKAVLQAIRKRKSVERRYRIRSYTV